MSIDCINLEKKLDAQHLEAQMNEEKTKQAHDLLQMTTEKYNDTVQKMIAVDKDILATKD